MKRKILIILLAIVSIFCLSFGLTACVESGGGNQSETEQEAIEELEYTLNSDGLSYAVTGIGTATDTNVVIASEYNDLPVTSIGGFAFYNCTSLTSITIPDSVISIGQDAFSYCTAEIVWGNNPTISEIGSFAFAYYDGTSITIPDSVISIGTTAFLYCTAEIVWGNNPTISEIGSFAFAYYDGTSITIPNSVISIGRYAFRGCANLKSVTFMNCEGWEAGYTVLSSTDLANRVTAATYLTDTYSDSLWKRSV